VEWAIEAALSSALRLTKKKKYEQRMIGHVTIKAVELIDPPPGNV